jgi:hypothetical protein
MIDDFTWQGKFFHFEFTTLPENNWKNSQYKRGTKNLNEM